jgi:hypothetical protein
VLLESVTGDDFPGYTSTTSFSAATPSVYFALVADDKNSTLWDGVGFSSGGGGNRNQSSGPAWCQFSRENMNYSMTALLNVDGTNRFTVSQSFQYQGLKVCNNPDVTADTCAASFVIKYSEVQ